MSIHEPHLVTISLGEAGDQILDVAQQGVSGGKCFLRTKPGIILQLHFSVFVSNVKAYVKVSIRIVDLRVNLGKKKVEIKIISDDRYLVCDQHLCRWSDTRS